MTNINNQFAQTLVQAGAKLGLDFANDKQIQKDAEKQIVLGGKISSIMGEQADSKNPITPNQALARSIAEGNKLGIPPKVSVGLYTQMANAVNAKAKQSNMTPSEFLNMQYKQEQIMESQQRQQERDINIGEKFQEIAAPASRALNTFKSAYINAKEAAGKDATFEQIVDELGADFPVEGRLQINKSNDPKRVSQIIAQDLMRQEPELSERFGVDEIANAIVEIMESPKKTISEVLGRQGGSSTENAPTPNSIALNQAGK